MRGSAITTRLAAALVIALAAVAIGGPGPVGSARAQPRGDCRIRPVASLRDGPAKAHHGVLAFERPVEARPPARALRGQPHDFAIAAIDARQEFGSRIAGCAGDAARVRHGPVRALEIAVGDQRDSQAIERGNPSPGALQRLGQPGREHCCSERGLVVSQAACRVGEPHQRENLRTRILDRAEQLCRAVGALVRAAQPRRDRVGARLAQKRLGFQPRGRQFGDVSCSIRQIRVRVLLRRRVTAPRVRPIFPG